MALSAPVAPEMVPQVPFSGVYWVLWHRGWCHRCRFWGRIGVCGARGGATGAVLGGELGSVAPGVVPLSGVFWGLWHHGWCHRCRFRGCIGACGTKGGATGTITADAIGEGVLSEIFEHIHDI